VHGILSTDILRQFLDFCEKDAFPANAFADVFLVADQESTNSYLKPLSESFPPGETGGYILAVDATYDPNDTDRERPEESPGYDGTLRILGSVLWDDVSALRALQTQFLEDLWPLAMHHPLGVYTGAVTQVQKTEWVRLREIRKWFYGEVKKMH